MTMESLVRISCLIFVFFFTHQAVFIAGQQEPTPTPPQQSVLELEVLGFRVWMIIGFVCVGFTIIIVALCCIFDCRIPRTKQQIEQDHERRELILHYKNKIKAIQTKKSRFAQARQRAAMLIGEWGREETGDSKQATQTSQTADTSAGASGDTGEPVPLAQHPSAMLMGSQENRNNPGNKPLGSMQAPVGNKATAKTLASLDVGELHTNMEL